MIRIAAKQSGTSLVMVPLGGAKVRAQNSWMTIKPTDKIYLNGQWNEIGGESTVETAVVLVEGAAGGHAACNGSYVPYEAEGVPSTGDGKLYKQAEHTEGGQYYWLQKRYGLWAIVPTASETTLPTMPPTSSFVRQGAVYIQEGTITDTGDVPYNADGTSCMWFDCILLTNSATLRVLKP